MYRAQYLTIVHLYKCIITKKNVNYCKLNNIEGKNQKKTIFANKIDRVW
jgi:hypothetical protein